MRIRGLAAVDNNDDNNKINNMRSLPLLEGPFVDVESIRRTINSLASFDSEDAPSVAESDVSSLGGYDSDENNSNKNNKNSSSINKAAAASRPLRSLLSDVTVVPPITSTKREPLQWEFKGLTLWVEFEEFDNDLTEAIEYAVQVYGTERIPVPHATAIYGMTHLSVEQAVTRLARVRRSWPTMYPAGVTQDIAVPGKPGQVCNIAWAEITLNTNDHHEEALTALWNLFEVPEPRQGPWTPHISLVYDNPEDSVLNMADTLAYVAQKPSLMNPRRVNAISLWNTAGKLADWTCLGRVYMNGDNHNNKNNQITASTTANTNTDNNNNNSKNDAKRN